MMNSDGHRCPRCKERVYFAEEVIAMGRHFHKACFTCGKCLENAPWGKSKSVSHFQLIQNAENAWTVSLAPTTTERLIARIATESCSVRKVTDTVVEPVYCRWTRAIRILLSQGMWIGVGGVKGSGMGRDSRGG